MGNLSALRSFSPSIDWSLYTGTWARSKQFFFQAYINTVRPDVVRTLPRSWELAAVAATAVVAAVVLGIVAEQLRPRLAAAAGVAPAVVVVVVVAAVAGLEPIRGSQRSSF